MNQTKRRMWPAVVVAALCLNAAAHGAEITNANVYYLGNSFCENSLPAFHPVLAKSAGKEMTVAISGGAGWQTWMVVDRMLSEPEGKFKSVFTGDWNTVVIQHFATDPLLKDNVRTSSPFNPSKPWPRPRDVSDFASASWIIDKFMAAHPGGRAFIYNSWPGIPAAGDFRKRVQDETRKSLENQGLSREEVLKRVKERKPTLEEMIPLMKAFNYEAAWLAKYEPNRENPGQSQNAHSRDYVWSLMELLKNKHPQLWAERRLALIPHGDVFLALDKKMRAGQVPGIENVGFFSRDGGHVRAGLPRYTLGATCFAVIFRENPAKLDYSIYNDLKNYENENINKLPGHVGKQYDHPPDLGVLLEITPERAKIVNETIWEVVNAHSYTQVKK